ncbi:endonuclease [Mycolicibacterium duvalii]|uniref:Endonuclease/exonuclease/phosphatase n=1 Tax=Mycolicibacterium duvalii TaxID=39688 RepID=A0A7I7K0S7_9MYCO|nr:endonuclease/exonuclease/phosphatase family protein [Mycolicibacterium duvalii]MCV7370514.1 endonuclease/exonuclease/phosphatase family protein [Mycolicibacterium duvalii]PEG37433.1 endonuclease [Mycolicibacterium duvalii]BBX17677.1 endonuclease/exonuclease/phosphatase [Mycolicibacterium duvalii]
MKLVTFNILHGRTPGGDVDLGRFADCVAGLDADILALQEVDSSQERSGLADLTALAAEAMGARSHRFVAAIAGTPGATWMAATGEEQPGTAAYGVALLSRYPALNWQVVRLPRVPFRFPMYLRAPGRIQVIDEEPRAAVIGRFDTPLGDLTVVNTHLSFVPGWNRIQLRRLLRDVRALPWPRVVTGDLNMSAAAAQRHSGLRALASAPTFPTEDPTQQLDHVLTDDPGLNVKEHHTPRLAISDHRPLVAHLHRDS